MSQQTAVQRLTDLSEEYNTLRDNLIARVIPRSSATTERLSQIMVEANFLMGISGDIPLGLNNAKSNLAPAA